MSEKRSRQKSGSKFIAILEGAASVLDVGVGASFPKYRGQEADAAALRGDQRLIGRDIRKAMKTAG